MRSFISVIFLIAVAQAAYVQKIYDNAQCSGDYIGYTTFPIEEAAPQCVYTSCTNIPGTDVYAIDVCGQEFTTTVPGFGEYDIYADNTCATLIAKIAGKPSSCVSTTAITNGLGVSTYQFMSACDGLVASLYLYYDDVTCSTLVSSSNATSECMDAGSGSAYTKAPTCAVVPVAPVAPPMTPVAPPMATPVASAPTAAPVDSPKAAPVATPVKKTNNAAAIGTTVVSVIIMAFVAVF